MTPAGVKELVTAGHIVYVEERAGKDQGFTDSQYREAGAQIKADPETVWSAEIVVKVKEPLASEYQYFETI